MPTELAGEGRVCQGKKGESGLLPGKPPEQTHGDMGQCGRPGHGTNWRDRSHVSPAEEQGTAGDWEPLTGFLGA